ncbi:hypothetical protein D917_03729, partial [Trichinella nativa]
MDCGRSAFPLKERNANRIVGGWEANPHSIPWQVYIEIINFPDLVFCGGSIIQLKPAVNEISATLLMTSASLWKGNIDTSFPYYEEYEFLSGSSNGSGHKVRFRFKCI